MAYSVPETVAQELKKVAEMRDVMIDFEGFTHRRAMTPGR
jgi:hypothetical protein